MKLISYGIIGLMVILSLFAIENTRIDQAKASRVEERYIKVVVENAVEDASLALKNSANLYVGKEGVLTKIDPPIVIRTFFQSLSNSLAINNEEALTRLANYTPVIALIDNDGYYLYVSVSGDDKDYSYKKILLPKIYFQTEIGNSLVFWGKDLKILSRNIEGNWLVNQIAFTQLKKARDKGEVLSGIFIEKKLRDLLNSPSLENFIVQQKLKQIESDLKYYTNVHNTYVKEQGLGYVFQFAPLDDSWTSAVQSPNILVLFQGYPLSGDRHMNALIDYDLFIDRDDYYIGYTKKSVKYYCKSNCKMHEETFIEELFSSEQEAAQEGYYPCKRCLD